MIDSATKILQQFASSQTEKEIVNRELDKPDVYGVSLIHYLTTLDYFELIEVIAELRADVNIKA